MERNIKERSDYEKGRTRVKKRQTRSVWKKCQRGAGSRGGKKNTKAPAVPNSIKHRGTFGGFLIN